MKKILVIIFIVAAWGLFFWTAYEQIPEVKYNADKLFPGIPSLEGIFQSVKEIQQKNPFVSDSGAIPLQQINNVGYSFYIGQIDYSNAPALNDDIKNKITDVIYKANFPKSLLKNVAIILVNTLAVSSFTGINTPYGEIGIPSFTHDFMTGGGIYSQNSGQMSLIFINKTMLGSIDDILTHELGHHIASQLTDTEWTKYYQLRKIPIDTPRYTQNWTLSPGEDFAEVYKNTFTGLRIKTYYGLLVFEKIRLIEYTCGKIYSNLENNYFAKKYPDKSVMFLELESLRTGIDVHQEAEANITPNAGLQNCRKDVLLHPEKYPTDWQRGVPYYSLADQATKDFITQIISRLN